MKKPIGKISSDLHMSCSQLPALMLHDAYRAPNDCLQAVARALSGERRKEIDSFAIRSGNHMENFILKDGAKTLGFNIDINITEPVASKNSTLQGSLDGIIQNKDSAVIKTDTSKNIYCIEIESDKCRIIDAIEIDGPGVAEAKLTSRRPQNTPYMDKGPIQAQGLMLCTGYSWAVIMTAYGTIPYYYFISADPNFQNKISEDVKEFDSKISEFKKTNVMPWYPAITSNDAQKTWNKSNPELPAINLSEACSIAAEEIIEAKRLISACKNKIDLHQAAIQSEMGAAEVALATDEEGLVTAEVSWGMSGARREYTVAAKPEKRAASLKIVEVQEPYEQ
jgi:hypothetical protein|tara:strand:- start:690 stop:1700 length:1011 start_codon:yes stop_codon:yes gene_type:complete